MSFVNGKVLRGQTVNDHKFQGVTSLNQIEDYGLLRPTVADKKSQKGADIQEQGAREMHHKVQRRFDVARRKRAELYSGYIERVEVHNGIGGTPAITIYHSDKLESIEDGVVIPFSAALTAIDGETQTEARYMLRERNNETGNTPIAITIYHGIDIASAQQILHDYNSYAKPVTESQMFSFNSVGKLSNALIKAIDLSGLDQSHINARGAKSTKKTVVASKQIMNALVGCALNGAGAERAASGYFKSMNTPDANDIPDIGITGSAKFIKNAVTDERIGNANAQVWQMAGVLLSKGVDPDKINWSKGIEAYEATVLSGRGGKRIPIKDRLQQIESVLL